MFFGFDDDQLAFRDAVRDLLDKQCPPEAVRAAWDGDLDRGVLHNRLGKCRPTRLLQQQH